MRQVGVQVQDYGVQLCWQAYVDLPGDEIGVAKLVHIAAQRISKYKRAGGTGNAGRTKSGISRFPSQTSFLLFRNGTVIPGGKFYALTPPFELTPPPGYIIAVRR